MSWFASLFYLPLIWLICSSPQRGQTALVAFGSLLLPSSLSTILLAAVMRSRDSGFLWGGLIGIATAYAMTVNRVWQGREKK